MRYYEAIYIAHPSLEQEDLTKLIEETKGMLKKRGGELVYEEVLGKKRLAYPVQKQRFGTYVLLQFSGDGTGNARLTQDMELNDNILAHMVVRIEEDEVRETRADVSAEVPSSEVEEDVASKLDEEAIVTEDEKSDEQESDTEQVESSVEEKEEIVVSEGEDLNQETTE